MRPPRRSPAPKVDSLPLDTADVFYRHADPAWTAFVVVPGYLQDVTICSPETDLTEYGLDGEGERPVTSVYPPRRKSKELRGGDLERGLMEIDSFLEAYDEMVLNLARLKATAEAIRDFHRD